MNLFGKDPRPKFNEAMRKELAEIIGQQVYEWLDFKSCKKSRVECIEDTYEILSSSHVSNGYELAREFEDKGYSPDAELVGDLDCIHYEESNILTKHIKQWVIDNKIEPEFEVGETVMVEYHGIEAGVIDEIRHSTAEYVVIISSAGHTKENGRRGIIKYENCHNNFHKETATNPITSHLT